MSGKRAKALRREARRTAGPAAAFLSPRVLKKRARNLKKQREQEPQR